MNFIHSTLDALRDRYAPISHTSTFRQTGQLTPEEFVMAGDFLVYKFPSWSWSDASSPSKRVAYLPDNKQFLVTRGVPCHRRLDDYSDAAGGESGVDVVVREGAVKDGDEEDEGWLSTGGRRDKDLSGDVRTLDGSGNVAPRDAADEEDEIPDMEDDDDDDEAIIKDAAHSGGSGAREPLRTYSLYVTYTPYYRTPRFYLQGYAGASTPLAPTAMMEDIVGDYKDKTVTLEDFPFFEAGESVKMASIHPCKHASVMKVLLDRADAALKLRRERVRQGKGGPEVGVGMEGLVDATGKMSVSEERGHKEGVKAAGGGQGDEWEVLDGEAEEESAIRTDQYLVVFLKFMASVTPTIEYDFTMSV